MAHLLLSSDYASMFATDLCSREVPTIFRLRMGFNQLSHERASVAQYLRKSRPQTEACFASFPPLALYRSLRQYLFRLSALGLFPFALQSAAGLSRSWE